MTKPREGETLSERIYARLTPRTVKRVKVQADAERRTPANMLTVLIEEALDQREAK